jgi:hypothetical protein
MYPSVSVDGSGISGFFYAKNSSCGPVALPRGDHKAVFDFGGLVGLDSATGDNYRISVGVAVR